MKTVLTVIGISLCTLACSMKPAETKVEKKMVINEETGQYEEKEVYSTTIFSNESNKLPQLKLPKKK